MPNSDTLNGAPTKRFFVSMLPRDIELDDAILDLVDNSVDGAMRSEQTRLDDDQPFKGYRCNLTVDAKRFELQDNCGGIPDDYLQAAFRLGRPNVDLDNSLPSIGVYGIGMKRAIFKIARSATVFSRSIDRAVRVDYAADYLDPDSEKWDLPMAEIEKSDDVGVTISTDELQEAVSKRFGQGAFKDQLRDKLGSHFAYIMGRGFEILLNEQPIVPETVRLILSDRIQPFDYEAEVGSVRIKVTIGFYRNLTRQAELEEATDPEGTEATDLVGRTVEEAGITVICNDRVIVMSDRTSITGWGVSRTPRYHPQFRAIAGLITFHSNDASLLPISTTKRDLDTDSDKFLPARNAAMDGIQLFVGFTNKWKGSEEMVDELLKPDGLVEAHSILLAAEEGKTVRGGIYNEKAYKPSLPMPDKVNRKRRIAFSREMEEIRKLGQELLGDESAKPGNVGVAAWETALEQIKAQ